MKLSDGREAAILKGKGKDLIKAAKVAGANATSMELSFALASALTQIDGKPVVYEDLGEMPLDDVMTIINAVGEGPKFDFPTARHIIHLCRTTGWRLSEVEELEWGELSYWIDEAMRYSESMTPVFEV